VTEAELEWLTSDRPLSMLHMVGRAATARRLRLAAVGAVQITGGELTDIRSLHAVAVAELVADGGGTDDTRRAARTHADDAMDDSADDTCLSTAASATVAPDPFEAAYFALEYVAQYHMPDTGLFPVGRLTELLRDIFGNPFRPVTIARSCRTPTVVALAKAIYADRAFDRLPILADALEEAGCDDTEVLAHCRGDGPHVRGCFVVDLLLDKR
jgi:hypothetical protein